LFENQLPDTQQAIYDEVQRVAGGDPRLYVQNVYSYPQQNGMLIQIILQTVATTTAQQLSIFFDQTQRSASYV